MNQAELQNLKQKQASLVSTIADLESQLTADEIKEINDFMSNAGSENQSDNEVNDLLRNFETGNLPNI